MAPTKIKYVVLPICTLHNFLLKLKTPYATSSTFDQYNADGHNIQMGDWRTKSVDMVNLQPCITAINACSSAKMVRETYMDYFNGNGSVDFQDEMLRKGKA